MPGLAPGIFVLGSRSAVCRSPTKPTRLCSRTVAIACDGIETKRSCYRAGAVYPLSLIWMIPYGVVWA
jgi:hypothetical protein